MNNVPIIAAGIVTSILFMVSLSKRFEKIQFITVIRALFVFVEIFLFLAIGNTLFAWISIAVLFWMVFTIKGSPGNEK